VREPPEHGKHPVEKPEGLGHVCLIEVSPGNRHPQCRSHFVGAPGRDPPVVQTVFSFLAALEVG
jgi:hypothetical protein